VTEKTQDFRTILAEQIYGAAKTAEFRFNVLKSRGHRMLRGIQPQMDLFDVATDRDRGGFELRFRRHPLFDSVEAILDSVEAITDRLHGTGDKADQIFIRLRQWFGCYHSRQCNLFAASFPIVRPPPCRLRSCRN
jgi:hypothetical protein